MIRLQKTILFLVTVVLFTLTATAQTTRSKDSIPVKKDTIDLKYDFKYTQKGGLFLDDLAKKEVIFDKDLNKYVIIEKIGDYYTRTPIFLTRKEYVDIVCDQLEYLNEDIVINRITGDPHEEDLIEPFWLQKKFCVLNEIDKELVKRNTYQGKKC